MLELKTKRSSINFLKGIAIGLVTYFHLWRSLGQKTLIIGDFDLTLPFHFGDLGVNLFIFISGFLVVNSLKKADSFKGFLSSRFKNLFPLYFLAIVFYYICAKAGYSIESLHNLSSVILHLTFTHTLINSTTYSLAAVLWYMGLIMQLYIVGYYIHKLRSKNKILPFIAVALLIYISFNIEHPIITDRFVGKYSLVFYLGMISNYYYNNFIKLLRNKSILTIYILFFIFYCFNTKVPPIIRFKYINYTTGFIYLFFPMYLMIIEQFKEMKNSLFKIITFLGEISYPLYLFNYSYRVISKTTNTEGVHGLVFNSIFLIVITLMANELNKFLKKF